MVHCSVCRREIILLDSNKVTTKHRRNSERKYTHTYCRWRVHNFWKHDLWSVMAYFIFSLICFIFLILAGALDKNVIFRNVGYILLAWTIIFSIWLVWINYLKMYKECCDYYATKHRVRVKKYIPDDEMVTKEDILE